jgi:hypothetical protein
VDGRYGGGTGELGVVCGLREPVSAPFAIDSDGLLTSARPNADSVSAGRRDSDLAGPDPSLDLIFELVEPADFLRCDDDL